VKEFYSYCGGLPALECANSPLGFKFSWSPRGAILSQCNSASFLSRGKRVDIAAEDLMTTAKPYFVMEGYEFVAYANRDSVRFREFYKILEAETVIRGSLRYEGNPMFIKALADIGWLDAEEKQWFKEGVTWVQIQQHITGASDSSGRYFRLLQDREKIV
jgi:saccharopine dehydrogenase (NADP+, L-glutamate forming)